MHQPSESVRNTLTENFDEGQAIVSRFPIVASAISASGGRRGLLDDCCADLRDRIQGLPARLHALSQDRDRYGSSRPACEASVVNGIGKVSGLVGDAHVITSPPRQPILNLLTLERPPHLARRAFGHAGSRGAAGAR